MTEFPKPQRLMGKNHFSAALIPLYTKMNVLEGSHMLHDHDFMEIAFVTEGHGMHLSAQGERPLAAGDVIVLRPGVWHAYRECLHLGVYNCCFGLEMLQKELALVSQDPALNYLFWAGPLSLDRKGLILLSLDGEIMQTCQTHLAAIAQANYLDQIGHLLLLLGHLARHMGPGYREVIERTSSVHSAVIQGRALIEERYSEPWTLSDIAKELHIADAYFIRLFKANIGLSPMAYLTRVRAERAAKLLLRTDRSISQIGIDVGWPDPNYFARRFKNCFGLSATNYRAKFTHP